MRKIILGSTSPYRRELLERLKIAFTTASPDIDESALPNEKPKALVIRLAEAKAREIAKSENNALIISGDQIAVCDETILGKSGNRDTAIKQLQMVSGKSIVFESALCLFDSATHEFQIDIVPFTVHFKTLTQAQIENYLDKEPAFNCAGSFKSEGLGICLTEKFEGDDPTALIGLPLIRLTQMLANVGVDIV